MPVLRVTRQGDRLSRAAKAARIATRYQFAVSSAHANFAPSRDFVVAESLTAHSYSRSAGLVATMSRTSGTPGKCDLAYKIGVFAWVPTSSR